MSEIEGYEKQAGALRSINDALKAQVGWLEKKIAADKEAGKSTYAASRQYDKVSRSQGILNDYVAKGVNLMERYSAAAIASASALQLYKIATEGASKGTELFLQTGQRIDNVSASYRELTRRGVEYQKVQANNAKVSRLLGIELEKVTEISDTWQGVHRVIGGTNEETRKTFDKLTRQTVLYSRILGVDGVELVKKAEHRMWQYGESGTVALNKIMSLRNATVAFNESMGKHFKEEGTYLWPEDFARIINEAAGRTTGFVDNIESLSSAMQVSIMWAQKAGLSYNESVVAGEAMGKMFTGATGAAKINIGMRIADGMEKALDASGKLKAGVVKDLTETEKAEIERIMALQTSEKQRSQLMYDALAGSKQAVSATLDAMEQWRIQGESTIPFLTTQFGMTEQQASLYQSMIESGKTRAQIEKEIAGHYAKSRELTLDGYKNLQNMQNISRAIGKSIMAGPFGTLANTLLKLFDMAVGQVEAIAQNSTIVFGIMITSGALAFRKVMTHWMTIKTALGQAGLTARALVTLTAQAALHAQRYAAAINSAGGGGVPIPGAGGGVVPPGGAGKGGKGGGAPGAPGGTTPGGKKPAGAPGTPGGKKLPTKVGGGTKMRPRAGGGIGGMVASTIALIAFSKAAEAGEMGMLEAEDTDEGAGIGDYAAAYLPSALATGLIGKDLINMAGFNTLDLGKKAGGGLLRGGKALKANPRAAMATADNYLTGKAIPVGRFLRDNRYTQDALARGQRGMGYARSGAGWLGRQGRAGMGWLGQKGSAALAASEGASTRFLNRSEKMISPALNRADNFLGKHLTNKGMAELGKRAAGGVMGAGSKALRGAGTFMRGAAKFAPGLNVAAGVAEVGLFAHKVNKGVKERFGITKDQGSVSWQDSLYKLGRGYRSFRGSASTGPIDTTWLKMHMSKKDWNAMIVALKNDPDLAFDLIDRGLLSDTILAETLKAPGGAKKAAGQAPISPRKKQDIKKATGTKVPGGIVSGKGSFDSADPNSSTLRITIDNHGAAFASLFKQVLPEIA